MRKRIIISFFCVIVSAATIAQNEHPDNSIAQSLEDFEFALHELESSYAGFETQITEANRQQYDSIVATMRNQIETQNRPGYDAVLYLYSWFDDGHLGMDMGSYRETCKYMSEELNIYPF